MRYTQLFGKTVKSVPADFKETSHKLLYKGGFIRQVATGRYAFLPLGLRVRDKITDIINEEMEAIGSQKLNTPIFHPIEIWQSTNRDKAFGGEMHIIEDHHGATFAIGATAEGVIVELIKQFNVSYKDLPTYVHQFVNKFRDEKRPKGGLIRVREFEMKDAYSFDATEEGLFKTYQKFYDAYLKIAKRLDLKVYPALADSGAIGGDYNHEFIVESDAGESEFLTCDSCDYSAQIERAESHVEPLEQEKELKEVKEYWDDEVVTCELLAKKMGVEVKVTTKTILFNADGKIVAAMVRGDYDISETKLKNYLGADEIRLANESEVMETTGAKVGFAGPVGLPENVVVVADLTCEGRTNFEAGGNQTGLHLYNLNYERDFPTPEFVDIREVKEGDTCAECKKGKLELKHGIEWGHCFKLDQFYAKPHNATFKDAEGEDKVFWMGSYGIGLGRSVATIVETHNDKNGIIWPESIAPYQVHLIGLNLEEKEVKKQAEEVYEKLVDEGIEVLYDDREGVRAGAKFADADLIGCPHRLVISKKTGDMVEYKARSKDETENKNLKNILKQIK